MSISLVLREGPQKKSNRVKSTNLKRSRFLRKLDLTTTSGRRVERGDGVQPESL